MGIVNPSITAAVISLQVGLPQTLGRSDATDRMEQVWTTGFFKEPTTERVWLGHTNLTGDGQADLVNHGGPEKAVNVYPVEHYPYWAQTLSLTDLPQGAFGENFTTEGLQENDVCIGDVFEVGEALVQISQPRQPCWKLARRWRIKNLSLLVQETGRTGWYFRVLREGHVQTGNKLLLVERPCPQWTVATANQVMHHDLANAQATRELADCGYLASRWRTKLDRRVTTGVIEDWSARLEGPSREKTG